MIRKWTILLLAVLLWGCQAKTAGPSSPAQSATAGKPGQVLAQADWPTEPAASTSPATATLPSPPTLTPPPTATATPQPTATQTPLPTATATPISACENRVPQDGLLTLVTQVYGLSAAYEPADLVPLSDYLPAGVTLGYPTQIRRVMAQPLVEMVSAMQAAGLQPTIISGYRSYVQQSFAWNKWVREEPERAAIISARPGHSEHQLGLTLDFGSPELPAIVGQANIQFHTYFYMTSEGQWLAEHAHEYGFTMSYPLNAYELTGFYYEPWHFRYVGSELAAELQRQELTMTEYLLAKEPVPCIP